MRKQDESSQLLKDEITNIVSKCIRCRFCFSQCPVYEVSDGWVCQGGSGITQSLYYGIKFNKIDKDLRDILMRCTTCRSCEIICERLMAGVNLVSAIRMGRQLLIEQEINPIRTQQKALESLQTVGNPYGKQPSKRTQWAENLNLKRLTNKSHSTDTLYYVGCTASYDDRVNNVAKSIAEILKCADVSFGILENEKCSGDPALIMGELGLFEMLVQGNIARFTALGITTIITTSPHEFNCFLKEYPKDIKDFQIFHYTQFFSDLINDKRVKFKKEMNKIITFHDPCYLGKHNNIYEQPREILQMIPGIELREMQRNRENSLCCGGGGGRMWADFDEQKHLAEIRVLEALDTGAEIIATACPFCLLNLEDAIKVLDKEDAIIVKDIAEIMIEAM
jgi:Fe-S oxidoreductase